MKLYCLSDLHLDRNSDTLNRHLIFELIEFLNSIEVDAILISGDFATGYLNALELINLIHKNLNKTLYFIPGNHDIYHKEHSFWKAYHTLISHPSCISNKIIDLTNDYCLIGDMGWFDMSLSCNNKPIHHISKTRIWNDEQTLHLPNTDETVTQFFIDNWENQLTSISNKKIIFSTHFVPWERFTIYKEDDNDWNYHTGFLGSKQIGNWIDMQPSIDYILFGHTHFRHGIFKDSNRTIICSPLGEVKDWETNDFQLELKKSGVTLTL